MSFLEHSIDLLISSNPALGGKNVSADGSSLTINLDEKLEIPKNALSIHSSVIGSEIWYNSPNIGSSLNNNSLTITANNQLYTVWIPEGLYSGDTIASAIENVIDKRNIPNAPTGNWFTISGDEALNKMTIRFNQSAIDHGVVFNWSTSSISEILGFTNDSKAGDLYVHPAQEVPKFNKINYYLIQSNMVHNGLSIGGSYQNIMAKVLIDVSPNSQILYRPSNPAIFNNDELAGTNRRSFRFSLLDDSLKPVNTRGEYWSGHIRITYQVPSHSL